MSLDPKAMEALLNDLTIESAKELSKGYIAHAHGMSAVIDAVRASISAHPDVEVPGFDATDLDMIRSGDMLGPKLGQRVYDALVGGRSVAWRWRPYPAAAWMFAETNPGDWPSPPKYFEPLFVRPTSRREVVEIANEPSP